VIRFDTDRPLSGPCHPRRYTGVHIDAGALTQHRPVPRVWNDAGGQRRGNAFHGHGSDAVRWSFGL
jgi:hypothetical protein